MKNLKEIIIEYGVNDFAKTITDTEADRLHKRYFGVKPKEIGALGIHSPHDHTKAILSAILSDKPYDERQSFRDLGFSDEEINNIVF